jgi:hypothetical protein
MSITAKAENMQHRLLIRHAMLGFKSRTNLSKKTIMTPSIYMRLYKNIKLTGYYQYIPSEMECWSKNEPNDTSNLYKSGTS